MEKLIKDISRRDLIKGVGLLTAGAMLSNVTGLISKAHAKVDPKKWPWPYEKLDPEKTAEIAYNEWYRIYCGGAVISSIFSQLAEKIGEPYKSFPADAFIFYHGGVAGWGTMCGVPLGSNTVTNLIIGPGVGKIGELMGTEMSQWYSETLLPVYVPKNPKIKAEIPKSVSHSPLCHISVNRWMKVADKGFWTPERKDRCARLAASAAYHLVELLNAWKDGKYIPPQVDSVKGIPAAMYAVTAQHNCTDCHGEKVPTVNTKGNPQK